MRCVAVPMEMPNAMTHSPPIPEANRSPYPIAEPPHPEPAADETANLPVVVEDTDSVIDRLRALPLGRIGAAVGLGGALIAGMLLGWRRSGKRPARTRK